jgi:predicted secreted protein
MKRLALILLVCAVLAYGAAQAEEAAGYGIIFVENLTTGYMWTYVVSDESVLAVADAGYAQSEADGAVVGAGGTHAWSVSGLRAGTASVTFTYGPIWESDDPATVVVYTFAADANKNLTLQSIEGMPDQFVPKKAVVRLKENQTTGYTWKMVADKNGILKLDSDSYASDKAPEGMLGFGGVHTWVFSGAARGQVMLTFRYTRSSDESEEPAATAMITYVVDSDLNVTLLSVDGDYLEYCAPQLSAE